MSNKDNIININSYKNKENKKKIKDMIIAIAFGSAIFAALLWHLLNKSNAYMNVQIPESKNISFELSKIEAINPNDIIDAIDRAETHNKPMLLHFYTSWCKVCKKQLPIINEVARKFQNTDLKVMFVGIDKELNEQKAIRALGGVKTLHFRPRYLSTRVGFKDLLKTKSITFRNRIPFTVLIDRNSDIITQFSGYKSFKYFNKKVMKSLFKDNEDI